VEPRKRISARTIDEYLAIVSPAQRAALRKLRRAIQAAAPGAEECISYRLPAFRLDGKVLVAFGAATNHCAFYPMSGTTVASFKRELRDFDTSRARSGSTRGSRYRPLSCEIW
jgi:uncharacterized protein YdhG (YjbR/CyaY superfamily)